MSEKDSGGAAFPHEYTYDGMPWTHEGMTMRDYFAAQALVGLLSAGVGQNDEHKVSEACFRVADAMLAERSK